MSAKFGSEDLPLGRVILEMNKPPRRLSTQRVVEKRRSLLQRWTRLLFSMDRIKEIIKYKGSQVSPAELENLLQSHPDVVDAADAPYPNEEAGQIPLASIVRRLGSAVDESSIKAFVEKMVAPYKKIRRVMFINSLPERCSW